MQYNLLLSLGGLPFRYGKVHAFGDEILVMKEIIGFTAGLGIKLMTGHLSNIHSRATEIGHMICSTTTQY